MPFDPFDECFLSTSPPKNYTFSHQALPCRFEPPLALRKKERLSCPFKEKYCQTIINSDLNRVLTSAYSQPIKSTLAEPSTSVVVRSEQQFHGMDRQRFAQRRHLYEVIKSGTRRDNSRFGVDCTELKEEDRLGEYIGFIDLRQHYNKSPLALGFLVEPSHLRDDHNTFVINGEYAPLFGGPPSFRSTVYSMQDSEEPTSGRPPTIGAKCAQICVIMALGMLADRKAEIKGSFTITYMAWLLRRAKASIHPDNESGRSTKEELDRLYEQVAEEVDATIDENPIDQFGVEGLWANEVRDILRLSNASSAWYRIAHKPAATQGVAAISDRLVTRLIEAYVYARFPVILAVDSWRWQSTKPRPAEHGRQGHAATVVGIRRQPDNNEPRAFLIHDPGDRPFRERTIHNCLSSMLALGNQQKYSLIVVADERIRRHAYEAISWLVHDSMDESACFDDYYSCLPDTNYRIALLNRNSIFPVLLPEIVLAFEGRESKERKEEYVKLMRFLSLPATRFWCVCGYKNGQLQIFWLFNSSLPDGDGCDAKIVIKSRNELDAFQYNGTVICSQSFRFK